MKNIILTSLLAVMVAAPAFADDDPYTNDETYTGYCEIAHIGGNGSSAVTASANFSPKSYSCAAGTYLPDGDTWTAAEISADDGRRQCPANSYCGGGTYTYSEANDQGITACPTGYTLSDAGSSLQTQCYRNCAASDVDHLKSGGTMSGHYYYGDNNQCEPANENQCATGYHYVAAGPDLTTIIGVTEGPTYGFLSNDESRSSRTDTYGITNPGEFVVDYGNKGKIHGYAQCSSQSGTNNDGTWSNPTISSTLPDNSGQNCYCMLDGYTPNGGTLQSFSSPWVYRVITQHPDLCAYACANNCAEGLLYDLTGSLAFRAAVFGSIPSLASCSANTITINWGGYGTNNTETQSTQCTYGGDVTTPTTAPTKRGHTFDGWTFTLGN